MGNIQLKQNELRDQPTPYQASITTLLRLLTLILRNKLSTLKKLATGETGTLHTKYDWTHFN